QIVARPAVEDVVAVVSVDLIGTRPAGERVVSASAADGRRDAGSVGEFDVGSEQDGVIPSGGFDQDRVDLRAGREGRGHAGDGQLPAGVFVDGDVVGAGASDDVQDGAGIDGGGGK